MRQSPILEDATGRGVGDGALEAVADLETHFAVVPGKKKQNPLFWPASPMPKRANRRAA
jgi:hypothetical protein